MSRSSRIGRLAWPLAIYALTTLVFLAVSGDRLLSPSSNNHFVHLAQGWLEGRLHLAEPPPGTNDWACFDTVERGPCPNLRWRFPGHEERYRFFVSFPPLPAVLIAPIVAIFGLDTLDRLFWALLAGLGPTILFVALGAFRRSDHSTRSLWERLLLVALFAFGSVYFFAAVQGSVWFAAHVVATPLIALYLWAAIDARRPAVAGLALGLCFLTRPTTMLLAPFFLLEALRVSDDRADPRQAAWRWHTLHQATFLGRVALFAIAPTVAIALALVLNHLRFDDPLEFGHAYLQIAWRPRIEAWGLFSYHYLAKNLAVFGTSLPWLTTAAPYFMISRHGLALWVTTPNLLLTLWPSRRSATLVALWLAIVPVALADLLYQNSGWVQFGYRFALDYLPLLIALLAIGGRPFRKGFIALACLSIVINTFGAITFDRAPIFYDDDPTQEVLFQPD